MDLGTAARCGQEVHTHSTGLVGDKDTGFKGAKVFSLGKAK